MNFDTLFSAFYDEIFPPSEERLKFIRECVTGENQNKSALDIGCGSGAFLNQLTQLGFRGFGIDLSREMIEHAQMMYPHIAFTRLDMLRIKEQYEEKSFDFITCIGNALVFLPNTKEITSFLSSVRSLLKPDGKLVIQIINYDYVFANTVYELPVIETDNVRMERHYFLDTFEQTIDFNISIRDKRKKQHFFSKNKLYPLMHKELRDSLTEAGFETTTFFNGFNKELEENMVLVVEAY